MRTKLIGLMMSLMLLATFVAAAYPMKSNQRTISTPAQKPEGALIDVPVWDLGDSWTYQVNDISVNYSTGDQAILLHGSLSELPLQVTSTLGDCYTLSFETTLDGIGYITANPTDGPVNVSVSISDLGIQGTVLIDKTNLGIKDIALSFDNQKVTFDIIEQHYLPLPTWLHMISAKFTSDVNVNCSYSVALLSFPFGIGGLWDLVSTNFSVNGQIQSKLFNLLYFINKIAALFGAELLPAEIASLLPIINFNEALTTFVGTNVFNVPTVPGMFYCLATENVSVPAGNYEVFNITLMAGYGQCYYAPSAGSVIRLKGNFEDIIPFIKSIDMTLLDTTYS